MGHAGTLDPFATGLLIVLVGKATRLARYAEQQAKTYLATARLGFATTTDDLTGERLASGGSGVGALGEPPGPPDRPEVEAAVTGFLGSSLQRPPAYSAKKVDGQRSYARARRGETVELAPVPIAVHQAELLEYAYPEVQFRMTVTAGSYIRGIARDLGERLGTGGHLIALRREAIGGMTVAEAVALESLSRDAVRAPLAAVGHLPRLIVSAEEAVALGHGKAVRRAEALAPVEGPVVALSEAEQLLAIGRIEDGMFYPEVVLEAAG